MLYLLKKFFPYTGLGFIIVATFITLANIVIIFLGLKLTKKIKQPLNTIMWLAIVQVTILNTVLFFPQEFNPSVPNQLWNHYLTN